MSETSIATIDQYIFGCPLEHQERLLQLRQIIQAAAPNAIEKISWQMPTFVLHGNLIHFALNQKHIGLYPGPEAVAAFQPALVGYHCSKGTIQLPHALPLPTLLIQQIVAFCVEQNTKAAAEKQLRAKTKKALDTPIPPNDEKKEAL